MRINVSITSDLEWEAGDEYCASGLAEIKRGNYFQSLEHFERAIELDNKHLVALFSYAFAQDHIGEIWKAVHTYSKALKAHGSLKMIDTFGRLMKKVAGTVSYTTIEAFVS